MTGIVFALGARYVSRASALDGRVRCLVPEPPLRQRRPCPHISRHRGSTASSISRFRITSLLSHTSGNVISAYWPGFALLMALFSLAGAEWLCNPVLSALTVVAIAAHLPPRVSGKRGDSRLGDPVHRRLPGVRGLGYFVLRHDRPAAGQSGVHLGLPATDHAQPVPQRHGRLDRADLPQSAASHVVCAAVADLVPRPAPAVARGGTSPATCRSPCCSAWAGSHYGSCRRRRGRPGDTSTVPGLPGPGRVGVFPTRRIDPHLPRGRHHQLWVWAVPGLLVLACMGYAR